MAQNNNFVRSVWVSYSGKDQELVHKLTKYVNEDTSGNRAINDHEVPTPFRLLTYIKHENGMPKEASEYNLAILEIEAKEFKTTFLKIGEPIEELIQTIGANLRRSIFLSESYLNSYYCLQELMCCLVRQPFSPVYLVLIGFDGSFSEVIKKRSYGCLDNSQYTLAEALAEVYKRRADEGVTTKEFEIPEKHANKSVEFFNIKIKELKKRLRENVNELDEGQGFSLLQYNKSIQELHDSLSRYVDAFSYDDIIQKYQYFVKQQLEDWLDLTVLGEHVGKKYDLNKLFSIVSEHNDEAITYFCQILYKYSRKYCSPKDTYKEVEQIASIILTNIIEPEWAAEIHFNSLKNNPVRLAKPEKTDSKQDSDELFYIHLGLAAANMHHIQIDPLVSQSAPLKLKNIIDLHPVAVEEDELTQNQAVMELLALVNPEPAEEIEIKVKRYTDNPETRFELRTHIKRFQRKFRNSNHEKGKSERQRSPIVLSAEQNRFNRESSNIPLSFNRALEFINEKLGNNEKPVQLGLLVLSFSDCDKVVLVDKEKAYSIYLDVKELLEEIQK